MRRLVVGVAVLVMAAAGIVLYGADGATEQVRSAPTGCPVARPLPAGATTQEITSGGRTRSYLLYVPASYDGNTRAPVVLMFHGLGGDPQTVLDATGMDERSEADGTILVIPLGRGEPSQWRFREPAGDPDSDLTFVADLVQGVQQRACTDPSRLYAAGLQRLGADPGPGVRRHHPVRRLRRRLGPLLRAAVRRRAAGVDHLLPRHLGHHGPLRWRGDRDRPPAAGQRHDVPVGHARTVSGVEGVHDRGRVGAALRLAGLQGRDGRRHLRRRRGCARLARRGTDVAGPDVADAGQSDRRDLAALELLSASSRGRRGNWCAGDGWTIGP